MTNFYIDTIFIIIISGLNVINIDTFKIWRIIKNGIRQIAFHLQTGFKFSLEVIYLYIIIGTKWVVFCFLVFYFYLCILYVILRIGFYPYVNLGCRCISHQR